MEKPGYEGNCILIYNNYHNRQSFTAKSGVKRMPVILSRSEEMEWIRASNHLSNVLGLLNAYPFDRMNAYPVSEKVNWTCNNDPSMLIAVGDKLFSEIKPIPPP